MEWPPGTVTMGFATKEEVKQTCLQMLRCIYRNVEAALMFNMAYAQHLMKVLGMIRSITNSCVFYKKVNNKTVLIVSCHVDNMLIAGQPEWVTFLRPKYKKDLTSRSLVESKSIMKLTMIRLRPTDHRA